MKSYARLLALVLAVMMMVSLFAGCAPVENPSSSEPSQSSESTEPSVSESTEPSVSESTEPSTSESTESSTSEVEPEVTQPAGATATPTKKPTATPTKKPTATPTKKPTADKYAAEPDVDLGGFTLRLRGEPMNFLFNEDSIARAVEIRKEIEAVAKKMNFKIVATNASVNYEDYITVKKAIQSGSKTIGHFVCTTVPLGMAGAASGYFQDLNTIDAKTTGFDLDDPERFFQAMTNIAVFENVQYGVSLMGAEYTEVTEMAMGVFWMFNKTICAKAGYSAASILKLVRDYQWTLDKASDIIEATYVPDANGDGKAEIYGLVSYQRQDKYYAQLDGGNLASKVNGKYIYTANSERVLNVLNWLSDMYVTKKYALSNTSASGTRNMFIQGGAAFLQCAPNYLTQSQIRDNMDYFQANIGIVPSPVGENAIKSKKYINPTSNSKVYVMPATVTGNDKVKAATAFAAIAARVTDYEANIESLKKDGYLYDAEMVEMYKLIQKDFDTDPGYVTEISGTSGVDTISVMVLDITQGGTAVPTAVSKHENSINKILDQVYR